MHAPYLSAVVILIVSNMSGQKVLGAFVHNSMTSTT